MSELSQLVYYPEKVHSSHGYEKVTDRAQMLADYGLTPEDLVDAENGLQAAIYQRGNESVIAFAGT